MADTNTNPEASDLREALTYCKAWFERHIPTATLITGGEAEHPILTCINKALAKATAA